MLVTFTMSAETPNVTNAPAPSSNKLDVSQQEKEGERILALAKQQGITLSQAHDLYMKGM